ncbi:hypothetical protein [Streptomyces yangpuensis]|uniref:hypothetical protein n=1 Tax=Streptomyces yangpuensis TaxID=1648182 RepID=UPI00371D03A0
MATRRPTRGQPTLLWFLAVFLGTGCTMLHQTPAAAPTSAAAPSPTRSPLARDILLAQQFNMDMYGAGPVSCRDDLLRLTRGRPNKQPRVWVASGKEATGASTAVAAGLGEETRLCLHGFPSGGSITVTIKAGARTYHTPVKPVAELTAAPPAMDDLFNGRPMEVVNTGDGFLESGYWTFLPSEPALTDAARSGRFTVAARSGDIRAESEVPLRLPRGAATVEAWKRNHQIAVYGFPAGARVPIGLYRPADRADGRVVAVLQREVGRVVMPPHRVAVFTVPEDVYRTISVEPTGDEDPPCLSVGDLASCVT